MSEPLQVPEIIPPLPISASEKNVSTSRLPKVTTSNTEPYVIGCALSSSRATIDDLLNLLFTAEKLPPLPDEGPILDKTGLHLAVLRNRMKGYTTDEIQQIIYEYCLIRLRFKMMSGHAFIAEAADFSAVTIWEPGYAPKPEEAEDYGGLDPGTPEYAWEAIQNSSLVYQDIPLRELAKQRPIFADFGIKINAAKRKHLYPVLWKHSVSATSSNNSSTASSSTEDLNGYDEKLLFWHLAMTSRDPTKPPVKGAVRAVIEPFVERFIEEDGVVAIWLEAGSARARDVYCWFGFKVVEEIIVGRNENEEGLVTWCMMYTKE